MPQTEFTLQARVYFEDTDASGIVYHANYLRFAERARTEWLRKIGYDQNRLAEEQDLAFVVRKMTIDFAQPARLDDELAIVSTLERVGRASMVFLQTIYRDNLLLCALNVKVGCINLKTGKPQPMSDHLHREIVNAG
ncbi:MAG: tol-pal system-associated acyl-CoA thioesterase [Pseudomonadota bacterium]